MAIFRNPKINSYTSINNNVFKDKNLSLKAKGMLCTLLSLPDNWNFSEKGLCSLSCDSRTVIRSSLQELIDNGYLTREQTKDSNGKFGDMIYTIYDVPPLSQKPTTVNTVVGKTDIGKKTQYNTNLINNIIYNTKDFSNTNINNNSKDTNNNINIYIVEYLNSKANTNYKTTTRKTNELIKARINEGFTLDDFKKVIDNKTSDWKGTDYEKFLRPETLFGNKFEGYLNQKNNSPEWLNKKIEKKEITKEEQEELDELLKDFT